jgi:hypothetical protein
MASRERNKLHSLTFDDFTGHQRFLVAAILTSAQCPNFSRNQSSVTTVLCGYTKAIYGFTMSKTFGV